MLEVGCAVRSISSSRAPGPVKSVARSLGVSFQPGGRSMLNPAAALLASAAVTVTVDQPAGSAVDGLLSASIDLNPVGVSATEGTVAGVEPPPALPVPELFLFSARAVPTPIPAAMITATTSQRIRLPWPRPRPVRPPPVPGLYCPARSEWGCDGPAYCPYSAPDGGNGVVTPCCCGGGYPCPAPLGPYAGRSGGVTGRAGRAGLAGLAGLGGLGAENVGATRSAGLAAVNVGPGFLAGVGSAGLGAAIGWGGADGGTRAGGSETCRGS